MSISPFQKIPVIGMENRNGKGFHTQITASIHPKFYQKHSFIDRPTIFPYVKLQKKGFLGWISILHCWNYNFHRLKMSFFHRLKMGFFHKLTQQFLLSFECNAMECNLHNRFLHGSKRKTADSNQIFLTHKLLFICMNSQIILCEPNRIGIAIFHSHSYSHFPF